MPAANERALEKAKTIPADAIIFDLEDAATAFDRLSKGQITGRGIIVP